MAVAASSPSDIWAVGQTAIHFTGEEAYFSNVRITPAAPQNLKNGPDVAGSWAMRYAGDAGGMEALTQLHRDGNKVTGTWSGPLGEDRAITGTWRNG